MYKTANMGAIEACCELVSGYQKVVPTTGQSHELCVLDRRLKDSKRRMTGARGKFCGSFADHRHSSVDGVDGDLVGRLAGFRRDALWVGNA